MSLEATLATDTDMETIRATFVDLGGIQATASGAELEDALREFLITQGERGCLWLDCLAFAIAQRECERTGADLPAARKRWLDKLESIRDRHFELMAFAFLLRQKPQSPLTVH
jgi:hypothetical protein